MIVHRQIGSQSGTTAGKKPWDPTIWAQPGLGTARRFRASIGNLPIIAEATLSTEALPASMKQEAARRRRWAASVRRSTSRRPRLCRSIRRRAAK